MFRRLLVVCLALFAAAVAVPALARADDPALAPTPPMGFDDWNAYGCNVNASLIERTARYIHDSGMQRDGYRDVIIDDCWQLHHRSASGALIANPAKFPHGMRAVADYVHRLGLKFGMYEDAGTKTCGGYPGSYGHYAQDARTFASWGVDYLKFDQCYMPWSRYRGQTREHVDRILYTRMSHDLRATGRAIVFSMCNGWDREAQPWRWGAAVSNLWRTTHDIKDTFASTVNNFTGTVRFWRDARAGAFNDPDMLEIGNGGQTSTEYRAQFSLWAEMAAPLIAGTNLTTLSHADLAIYDNRRVIAVDQDRLARQGRPILHRGGTWALTKPLAGGAHAVVLFNATATPRVISVSARAAGAAPARSYALENLWTGAMTRTAGEIAAFVPAHGAVMDRVTSAPAASVAAPASVLSLQASPATLAPGASLRVRLPLTDESRTALGPSTLTVTAPAGFSPRRVTLRVPEVRHGVTAYGTIVLHAPSHPSAALRLGEIRAVDRRAGDDAALPVRMLSPLPSPWQENDLSGQPATVGGLGTDFSVTSAGTGVSIATSGPTAPTGAVHLLPADDSYTAVADPAVAGQRATAEVTVAAQGGSPLSPFGQAGLVMRDRLTAGTPEGAVLTVDTAGTVSLSWAGRGTSVVTHSVSAAATVHLPVRLRLTRRGAHYTGAWSTDGGRTWQTLATAQVTGAGGRGDQAVGILHSSGAAGWWTTAQFTGLSITR